MSKNKKKVLEKNNWMSSFVLVGEAKVNDYTFKLDQSSERSDWVYNALNLGVDCGEVSGTVYTEIMGGYGAERDNVVYVHGKKDDNGDDFNNRFAIDWDDRLDEDILESVGNMCFLTAGLERDAKGKVFYKKFLSPYDFIAYVNENLTEGMIVNVKGRLKYSTYNNETQVKKEISSIVLSKVDDSEKYFAGFTQTMLLTKDSVGKADKDKGVIPIHAKVLDYVKMFNEKEVKCNIPFNKTFEYEIDLSNKDLVQKVVAKVFKVAKGVTEITFEGNFIEGGAVITTTEDDIPADIKAFVEAGVFTIEEALARCTVSSGRERRMLVRKPLIKMVEDEKGNKTPVIQKFDKKYNDEDLILDFMYTANSDGEDEDDEEDVSVTNVDSDDTSWLDDL